MRQQLDGKTLEELNSIYNAAAVEEKTAKDELQVLQKDLANIRNHVAARKTRQQMARSV
jgi:ribosomal protein S7